MTIVHAKRRRLTSPCSRRAAARPGIRRGGDEPRPAAEGQLVRLRVSTLLRLLLASWSCGLGCAQPESAATELESQQIFQAFTRAASGRWQIDRFASTEPSSRLPQTLVLSVDTESAKPLLGDVWLTASGSAGHLYVAVFASKGGPGEPSGSLAVNCMGTEPQPSLELEGVQLLWSPSSAGERLRVKGVAWLGESVVYWREASP